MDPEIKLLVVTATEDSEDITIMKIRDMDLAKDMEDTDIFIMDLDMIVALEDSIRTNIIMRISQS